jgi:hypothetical protein
MSQSPTLILAIPQLGPGKIPEQPLDSDRFRETGDPQNRFTL